MARDHQHALDAALLLPRAEQESVNAAIRHFQAFFGTEGRRHFEIEARCLLPALPAHDPHWRGVS